MISGRLRLFASYIQFSNHFIGFKHFMDKMQPKGQRNEV